MSLMPSDVPIRVIKSTSHIRCHTFSEDGKLFALADASNSIQLYRTHDYRLVLTAARSNVHDMSFVDGGSHILRVLELGGTTDRFVLDFKIHLSESQEGLDDDKLELLRGRPVGSMVSHPWDYFGIQMSELSDFSDDGNTFMINELSNISTIYKFEGDILLHCFLFDPIYMSGLPVGRMPVLSGNGCSCLGFYSSSTTVINGWRAIVNVWPKFQFGSETKQHPIGLDGHRAAWTASGEYLATWYVTESMFESTVTVYKTSDLMDNIVSPVTSRRLTPGLHRWHLIGRRWPHCSFIIREEHPTGEQQFLEWEFEKNTVIQTITTFRPTGQKRIQCPCDTSLVLDLASHGMTLDDGFDNDAFWQMVAETGHPSYCFNENGCCIASFNRNRQLCCVVSYRSNGVVINWTMPEEDVSSKGKWPAMLTFDRSGRHLLCIGLESVLVFAPGSLRRC